MPKKSSTSNTGCSKRKAKNSPSRPVTSTFSWRFSASKIKNVPAFGLLLARAMAIAVFSPVMRSINTSTAPPVSFLPSKRALITLVLFITKRSSGRSKLTISLKCQSSRRSGRTCKRRLAERSAKGNCAIRSAGRSKSKSDKSNSCSDMALPAKKVKRSAILPQNFLFRNFPNAHYSRKNVKKSQASLAIENNYH